MSPKAIFFLLVVIAATLEVAGDILFKQWTIDHKTEMLVLGIALYLIGTGFWLFSLKYEFLSTAITVFTVLNLVVLIAAGAILFGEEISTLNKAGMLLGIISVILMEL